MKRTSTWLPIIKQQISNLTNNSLKDEILELLSSLVLPEKTDFIFGASYGIVTLQDFHNFDVKNLSQGIDCKTRSLQKSAVKNQFFCRDFN